MAFVKSYLTLKGLSLALKLIDEKKELEISHVLGGISDDPSIEYSDRTKIEYPVIEFETNQEVIYKEPDQLIIPLYYENSKQEEPFSLTEIGLYAMDPDDGEILMAIATSYDQPLALPRFSDGRLELTCNFTLQLSLSPEINISLPSSIVYLTKPEADERYWRIGTKYPASEIYETTGETTEQAQRRQDERLHIIEQGIENGTTKAKQIECDTREPLKWKIINNNGYYDPELACFRAGGKYVAKPDPEDPDEPIIPDPETPEEPDETDDDEETVVIGGGGLTIGRR